MTEEKLPGALPDTQTGAFGGPNQNVQVVPQLPQELAAVTEPSKLDQILELVRQGKVTEAGGIIDAVAEERAAGKVPPEEPGEQGSTTTTIKPTGNKALDIAVSTFVSITGTTEEDITKAMQAAYEANDSKYIDKEYLKSRFGDKAEQAIALAEAVFEEDLKSQTALLNDVYATAGTKEQFDICSALFREHAKPAMRSVVKAMLDSGDPQAVKEAASLIAEFGKQSGAMVHKDGSRQISAAGAMPGQGLSAQEFQAARQQLNPTSRAYASDMEKLIQQRRLGKELGR